MYQRFVINFSRTAAQLHAKLEKREPKSFELDETILAMVEQLKEKLTTPPILSSVNEKGKSSLPLTLATNKSDVSYNRNRMMVP